MTGVRKSFLLSLADSYLALVLQLAATVIISRLLTPVEVGVFAISAVFMALASMVRDFGVTEYLIQERELTPQRIRATLTVNIIVSWAMAITLACTAPLVAAFYREEGVRNVMWVQALSLMMVPFGAVTMAWFRRELQYAPIVICNAVAGVVAFVVSVALALSGYGYMSLAWSSFAGVATTVLATMWFRPKGFPRWPGRAELARVFHFGKFASMIYIAGQFGKGAPELIIGRVRDAAAVGMFSRANGIVEMFNRLLLRPVMSVCLPYFARSERESGSLVSAYVTSATLLTSAGWPFLACLAVMAYTAIRIIYGTQWLEAVPLAQTLCLAAGIELVHTLSREALLARGDVRRANALQIQIVIAQVCGLAAGVPFGLHGACWGLVVAAAAGLVLSQWHLHQAIGLGLDDICGACRGSILLTLMTAVPVAVVAWWIPPSEANFVAWGLSGATAAAALWLTGLRMLRHPLWGEIESLLSRLRRRRPER